jgi:hypothetical protein
MTLTDDALAALVGVLGDIHSGRLKASENDVEMLVQTLDILNQVGDDNV